MSVRITWLPNTEPSISRYDIERSSVESGPWTLVAGVPHDTAGANYANGVFFYDDATGVVGSWYRIIAVDAQGIASSPSLPFQANTDGVDTQNLSIGTARFLDIHGVPQRTKLIIALEQAVPVGQSFYITQDASSVVQADASGELRVALPRGAKIRVALEGTTYVRSITVPDAPTFNLMLAMSEAPDQFTVQTTEPLVERRSF